MLKGILKVTVKTVFLLIIIILILHLFHFLRNRDYTTPPHGYPNLTILKIAAFFKFEKLVNLKPEIPGDIVEFKNLEYKNIDGISLQLDIYRLKTLKESRPCLIFIHGGGWKKGNRSDYLVYLLDLAKKGYVTATVSYRFSQIAKFPAAVNDVRCAVKWIKIHGPEFLIDTQKIALIGGSAGGHLALLVGYSRDDQIFESNECPVKGVNSSVQAIIDIYGPVDLTTDFAISNATVHQFLGDYYDVAPQLYEKSSPKNYISSDDPPTMILHGTIDEIVPISQSDSLKKWLDETGVQNEYFRIKGWPHTMDAAQSVNQYCQYQMMDFLNKYLPITY
jgi:acetyl esterase/lipase